ncbi:arginine transporter ATP-binding subunit [Yersinia frederiksenii]|uniref:Arginine transport ATP-binding protein ArtP n=2 Tax=Yersinia frederiksenii TaxID=29484 RepID=A0A380PRP2_YERFR|nr:Arginine transport ATP-binding protein artP [Yersinia frederiksenii ATCC 33641]CFQ94013.1 arginine transporter ATP-binding subunit [Yersinia frederiksenii]CNB58534.1 arginine transporter ATP-binding subunit [Yersinia frederiksenii]CNF28735.1 arginine transporter ATP-binding subunit [Yersinia frederiksenii]SUP76181.1 arginine transporter ATP-binding subunit [Yersinia frederiksenii]
MPRKLPFTASLAIQIWRMSIQLNGINCYYGVHQALFDITLDCPAGETLVLLGPSGAGKSSLLRVLNLLEMPRSGTLQIAGNHFDFTQAPGAKAIRELRQNVGMVFQQYNLWPHLSVVQNLIEAPCRVLGLSKDEAMARAQKLLTRLRLTDFADRFPLHLSGGQQQRVAIARALMMEPQVLLFDEPTAALDPEITAQIVSIIRELAGTGITQVIVTHEVEVARKTASRVVYMENGHIVEQGDASHFAQPTTEAFASYLSH